MAGAQCAFRLKQAYGAAIPPSTLAPDLLASSNITQIQNELVNDLLLAPHFQSFPPPRESRRIFWKWIVERLEAGGEEVDERIYEAYLDLLPASTCLLVSEPPLPSYNTHFWSSSTGKFQETTDVRSTTLLESRTMIQGGTTGLRTWGASLTLANWLVSHPDIIQDRRVLELGSGAGFLGLIIAALQREYLEKNPDCCSPPSLVLTDVNSDVLSRCYQNFQLSCNRTSTHQSLDFRLLDWSDALLSEANSSFDPVLDDALRDANTIIGADLVYDASIIPALVAVLALFFRTKCPASDFPARSGEPCAYVATTVRREQTVSAFLSCLSSRHLAYEEIGMEGCQRKQFLDGRGGDANCDVKLVRITPIRKEWPVSACTGATRRD